MSFFPLSSWSEDSKNVWLSSSPIWPYITHSPPGLTTKTKSSKSYDISSTDIYIGEDIEFIIHVFYWCIPLDHEIYTNCKKAYNLIKVLFSYNLFSGIKSQRAKKIKKKHLLLSTTNFWLFSDFLSSILLSHFRPLNCICSFNR